MSSEGNFWDDVVPSNGKPERIVEPTVPSNVKPERIVEPTVPDYIAREPQELYARVVSNTALFMIVMAILLVSFPFALSAFDVGNADDCWGSLEYLEDEQLHCVSGDESSQVTYSYSGDHVIASHFSYNYGYFNEVLRWEVIGDGGVYGFTEFDYYADGEDFDWFVYAHCEWMGGSSQIEQWYCAENEQSVSMDGYPYSNYYCESQAMHWYCTDSFGQNSSFSDTSNETRAGPEVLDNWMYYCMAVSLKSPFDENTTMQEVDDIQSKLIMPNWCDETPVFLENESAEPVLPFYGEAVYLYPNGNDNYGSIDSVQYLQDSFQYQVVSLHTYNAEGTLTEVSENAQGGLGIIGMVLISMLYLIGGYLVYYLSTGKHHIEHLGVENTLVISKSWRNKPKTMKSKISLDSSSLLHVYTVTSTSTDSEGHTTTSTSQHHRITHAGRSSDQLPDGFNTEKLLILTGLNLSPDPY